MPLPSKPVVGAMLDSYLTIRDKSHWNIVDSAGKLRLPTNQNDLKKIKIVEELLLNADKCNTIADWINCIDRIHEIEMAEMKAGQERFFVLKWFTDIPLLGHTLKAVRSYILDQIKKEINLSVAGSQLGADCTQITEYYKEYFLEITKKRDHRDLSEGSFDDFVKNVTNNTRKPVVATLVYNNSDEVKAAIQRTEEARRNQERERESKVARQLTELAAQEERRMAAEKVRQEKAAKAASEDALKRDAEKRRAQQEEERRIAAEKAKQEEAVKAAREDTQRREAEKRRAQEERERRRAEELRLMHEEEERREKESKAAAADQQQLPSVRQRRLSVKFSDAGLFAENNSTREDRPQRDLRSSSRYK